MDYIINILTELSLDNIIYHLLGFICHQDKTILFDVGDNLIPLCPRCLGLHTGFFLSLMFVKLLCQKPIDIDKPRNFFVIIFSIGLAGIHWSLGFFGLMEMSITSRIVTGLVSGAGFFLLLSSIKNKYRQSVFTVSSWNKKLLACLLLLLLGFNFFNDYNILLLSILVIVASNMISIVNFMWLIIRQNKNYNHAFKIEKEMQS